MLLAIGTALVLQGTLPPPPPPPPVTGRGRGATVVRDSTTVTGGRGDVARRLPVTAEVLATAFADAAALDLFTRARRTRVSHDSSIRSYDARAVQRFSLGLGLGRTGRERLMYRQESASRVQWESGVGAWIDLTGARVAAPMVSGGGDGRSVSTGTAGGTGDDLSGTIFGWDMSPIPYFPGYESLWIGGNFLPTGGSAARAEANDQGIVNPLANGAEAYYTYRLADSLTWRFPDGYVVRIREIQFRPRWPRWNLAVGSLWVDERTGQLVRAAYRLSIPLDVWSVVGGDADEPGSGAGAAFGAAFFSPLRGNISAVAVEYAMYEGRYWLPKTRVLEGSAEILFATIPLRIESAFSYASVNEPLALASVPVDTSRRTVAPRPRTGTPEYERWRDSLNAARQAQQDSIRRGLRDPVPGSALAREAECAATGTYVRASYRYPVRLPVGVRVPCDRATLMASPDLPASIYSDGEEVFGSAGRDELLSQALRFAAQAPFSFGDLLPRPRMQFGLSMTRYNKVEGVSTGLLVEQELGGGYQAGVLVRLGAADLEPNAELSFTRTNLSRTMGITAYNRLVSARDWGSPLTFGSSLSAFLFGRDEGFYYRASGAELHWVTQRGARLRWRVFGEQQRNAPQKTTYAVGPDLGPNIVASRGLFAGIGTRWAHTHGEDPQGFILFNDFRLEAAGSRPDSAYARAALDATVSRGLGRHLAASMTVGGGATAGRVPLQRHWFLGGTHTVRGQVPDTAIHGTAYWLGRAEIARVRGPVRTALFGDIGWTGDRSSFRQPGRPLSGYGIGQSFFDGVFRFDVARGIYPRTGVRLDLYLDAKF